MRAGAWLLAVAWWAAPLLAFAETSALQAIPAGKSEVSAPYVDAAAAVAEETRQKRTSATDSHREILDAIVAGSADAVGRDSDTGEPNQTVVPYADAPRSYLIFVSAAMSAGDIRSVLEVSAENMAVHVIFRGVPKEGGVDGFMAWLRDLTRGMEGAPRLTIDPPTWQQYGVTQVPTMIVLDHGHEIARVLGVANPAWMDARLASGRGDLGRYGEVVEPSEPDMMVMLKEATKHFDMDAYRQDAERQFWATQKNLGLPVVTTARTRRVDPSVTVLQDVVMPDGNVLAKKGDRINPLLAVAFDQRLIVIDASNPEQRAMAHGLVAQAGNTRVTVLSTGVPDPAGGFTTWRQWQEDIGSPLYLLSEQVRARLDVTHVPTLVDGDGDRLVLTELDPKDTQIKTVSKVHAGPDTTKR